jgi:hypothetical protein
MALPINTKEQLRQLYRIYSLVSDNAHGNTKGVTGSLNYSSLLLGPVASYSFSRGFPRTEAQIWLLKE